MKKVLALFALLMTVISSFAAEYKAALAFQVASMSDVLEERTLVIDNNGDGTYNLTVKDFDITSKFGKNLGDFICSNVAGTTSGGVTTIDVANAESTAPESGGYTFQNTTLQVKFNDTKAYVHWVGKMMNSLQFEFTFGTEDIDAGGETGKTTKVVDDNYAPNGSMFAFPFNINWDKQKLVAKLDLTTCKTGSSNENIFTVANDESDLTQWKGLVGGCLHLYYTKATKALKFHYLSSRNGSEYRKDHDMTITEPSEVAFELTKEGLYVEGTLLAPASELDELYANKNASLWFGSKQGDTRSWATYKSVEVVEMEQAPELPDYPVMPANAKKYADKLTITKGTQSSDYNTNVAVAEVGSGKYDIEIENVTFGDKSYGPLYFSGVSASLQDGYLVFNTVKAAGVAKNNDGKAVETAKMTINGRSKDNKIYLKLNGSYTEIDENLEMVFGDEKFPTPPTMVSKATFTDVEKTGLSLDDGDVEIRDLKTMKLVLEQMSDDTYNVTFRDVIVGNSKHNIGDVTIEGLTRSEEGERVFYGLDENKEYKVVFNCQSSDFNGKKFNVENFSLMQFKKDGLTRLYGYALLEGSTGAHSATVQIIFGEDPDAFKPVTYSYTDDSYVTFDGTTTGYTDSKAELTEVMEDVYQLTFKDFTAGKFTIGDFTIENISLEKDEATGNYNLTSADSKGTWSNVTDNAKTFLQITEGMESAFTINEATLAGFDTTDKADDKLIVKFDINNLYNDKDANVVYGETMPEPEAYPVNFDKEATNSYAGRVLSSVTVTAEDGEAQTVYTGAATSKKVYVDKSDDEASVITVAPGATLNATFNFSGEWMHGYVYIDENNDKQFSYKEGNTDQTGTELKAFSFYSGDFNDDSFGYNSLGDEVSGDSRNVLDPPAFTAPAEEGTYRIRFKVDWNSVDPAGQKGADGTCTGKNGILANGGAILDATLKVDKTVGIKGIEETGNSNDAYYDLSGRRLNNAPQHGVYIKNGKKFVK